MDFYKKLDFCIYIESFYRWNLNLTERFVEYFVFYSDTSRILEDP